MAASGCLPRSHSSSRGRTASGVRLERCISVGSVMRVLLKAFRNCQWEAGVDAAAPRRGRPPRISRAQIVQAARNAGEQPSMADVARALDVAPGALYHHVRDRDELLELVAAQVLEETAFDDWTPA